MTETSKTQWWLAEMNSTCPKLTDGPHSNMEGVEQALYIIESLGLNRDGRKFAAAHVEIRPVEAKPNGANEAALKTLNSIGLRSDKRGNPND